MSKFNTTTENSMKTVNHEGNVAYKMADKVALMTMVLTSFFNEQKFYGDNSEALTNILQNVIKDDLVDKFGSDEKSFSAKGFDEVYYLHTYDIGYQYLFLRKGKEIEYICYLGPENLQDHVETFIIDLK